MRLPIWELPVRTNTNIRSQCQFPIKTNNITDVCYLINVMKNIIQENENNFVKN